MQNFLNIISSIHISYSTCTIARTMYIHNTYTVCRSELLTLIGVAKQYLKVKPFFIIMKAICFEITKKYIFWSRMIQQYLWNLQAKRRKESKVFFMFPHNRKLESSQLQVLSLVLPVPHLTVVYIYFSRIPNTSETIPRMSGFIQEIFNEISLTQVW